MKYLRLFLLTMASLFVMSLSALAFAPGASMPAEKTATIISYDAIEGTEGDPHGYCEIIVDAEGQKVTSRETLDTCTQVALGQKVKIAY